MYKPDCNNALSLFIRGFSIEEIAEKMRLDALQVIKLIEHSRSICKSVTDSNNEFSRSDQLLSLNYLMQKCHEKIDDLESIDSSDEYYFDAVKAKEKYIQTTLKILQEKSKLLGLNSPVETKSVSSVNLDMSNLNQNELELLFAESLK